MRESFSTVQEYIHRMTPSGGIKESETDLKLSGVVELIVVRPTSLDTTYKFEVKETESGIVMDKARATRKGQTLIWKPIYIFESSLTFTISESSKDEEFVIKVRYI